jgi:hypothetical protein
MLGAVLCAALIGGGIAVAQKPERDINPQRHPNLAAAQELCVQAWLKVEEAQKANKDELGGHAQRALESLEQVNHELKQAAEFADHRK